MALPFIGSITRTWCGTFVKSEQFEDIEGGQIRVVGLKIAKRISLMKRPNTIALNLEEMIKKDDNEKLIRKSELLLSSHSVESLCSSKNDILKPLNRRYSSTNVPIRRRPSLMRPRPIEEITAELELKALEKQKIKSTISSASSSQLVTVKIIEG